MEDHQDVLEPVRLAASPDFPSGSRPDLLPDGLMLETDLDRAMELENSQEAPQGYRIWRDTLDAAVAPFHSTAKARKAEQVIEPTAEEVRQHLEPQKRQLQKKRIKSSLSEKEEFWLTVAYDSFEQLKLVAMARFAMEGKAEPFLEQLHDVYRSGFYPCGVNEAEQIVAFDVRTSANE